MRVFLAAGANFRADLNLTVQIVTGIVLVLGALLARAKLFRAHGACMTAVLLLNLVMIALVMWPSFHQLALPGVVKHFGRRYETIAAVHSFLGASGELLGLYILMVAGTDMIPERWRFQRWKLWMRIEFMVDRLAGGPHHIFDLVWRASCPLKATLDRKWELSGCRVS